jgi:hypothetical protein
MLDKAEPAALTFDFQALKTRHPLRVVQPILRTTKEHHGELQGIVVQLKAIHMAETWKSRLNRHDQSLEMSNSTVDSVDRYLFLTPNNHERVPSGPTVPRPRGLDPEHFHWPSISARRLIPVDLTVRP